MALIQYHEGIILHRETDETKIRTILKSIETFLESLQRIYVNTKHPGLFHFLLQHHII